MLCSRFVLTEETFSPELLRVVLPQNFQPRSRGQISKFISFPVAWGFFLLPLRGYILLGRWVTWWWSCLSTSRAIA